MSEKLLIGWGEADITPASSKVELAGQYYRRIATEVHSPLKAVVLALEKGPVQAILITLDVAGIPEALQREIAAEVHAANPAIAPEAVLMNATHTHNAPYAEREGLFREWLPLEPGMLDPAEYVIELKRRIIAAVREAWDSRMPGGIAPGFGFARLGHCRRPVYRDGTAQMYGPTACDDFVGLEAGEDSGVELVFTCDETGAPTGVLVNAACPSQGMEATYKISADFAGMAREMLKTEYGQDFRMLYLVGASGCQSPRDLVRNFRTEPDFWHEDGIPVLAQRLTAAVREGWANRDATDYAPVLRHSVRHMALPLRRVSFIQYQQAASELAELEERQDEKSAFDDFCRTVHANEVIPGRPGPYDDKEMHFVQIQNRKAVIRRFEIQNAAPAYHYDMHTLRLGDAAISTNPFELYLFFGQIIKARSHAARTMVVQLAGATGGYLPSPDAERFGGYGGMVINGQIGSDGGFQLAEEAVAAINELFGP